MENAKIGAEVYRLLQIGLVGNRNHLLEVVVVLLNVYRLLQIGLVGNTVFRPPDPPVRFVYRLLQIGLVGNLPVKIH